MPYDADDEETKAAVAAAIEEATSGLTAKNKELLSENKTLKQKVRSGDVDTGELTRLEAERDDLAGKLTASEKALKAAQKANETATAALATETGFTSRLLVDNGLAAALAENGVLNAVNAKAAAAMLRASSKIEVRVDGENRGAFVGDKPLGEFVKEWSQSDEGKHFVTAQPNGGGGAQGGGQKVTGSGNMGGDRGERVAAIGKMFPNLPVS